MKSNRTVLRTLESMKNREAILIYKVEDLVFNPESLREGYKYEIKHRYGRSQTTSLGRYYGCTEDARTLIFQRLDDSGISMGIPSMNIYSIDRIGI
jgi:hypothetical protein